MKRFNARQQKKSIRLLAEARVLLQAELTLLKHEAFASEEKADFYKRLHEFLESLDYNYVAKDGA